MLKTALQTNQPWPRAASKERADEPNTEILREDPRLPRAERSLFANAARARKNCALIDSPTPPGLFALRPPKLER